MKIGAARSDIYTVQYPDGRIEHEVPGYVWTVKNKEGWNEYYFDKYPHIGYRVDWMARYNEFKSADFTVLAELIRFLGKDGFKAFKREWAKANCPKLEKSHFKVMQVAPLNGWGIIIKRTKYND